MIGATISTTVDVSQTLLNLATAVWLASVGASVGSFLNVVAYRLPLGASIVWIPSRCPKCGYPIRLRDNIPLLSWLMLRGRCRDCGVRISPRYFVVEAAMAIAFLLLAYLELFSGGTNLPDGPLTSFTGAWGTIWHPEWGLIGVYVYHCALLSVLMAVVLIDMDGSRLPWSLVGFGIGLSLVAKHLLPTANVISGPMILESLRDRPVLAAIVGAAFGAVVCGALAFGFARLALRESAGGVSDVDPAFSFLRCASATAFCGSLVGVSTPSWWALVSVWSACWVFQVVVVNPVLPRMRRQVLLGLWPTTLALLLWWKPLAELFERATAN